MKKLEQNRENLKKTIENLQKSIATPPVEDRDYGGIVKAFENAYELTWKTLKIILEDNGVAAPFPRITFEESFKRGLVEGNEIWKDIIEARNQSVHTYDKDMAIDLCKRIATLYTPILVKTYEKIKNFSVTQPS